MMAGGMSLFESDTDIQEHYASDARIILNHGDVNGFLRQIPDETVRLVFTSPPYNLGKAYESRVSIRQYLSEQSHIIKELYRVLAENGSLCWQVGNYVDRGEVFPLDILYYDMFKECGFRLRNRIIWRFEHGLHASKRFSGRYETILWFTKSDHYLFNLDDVRIPAKYPGKRYYKGPNRGKPSCNPKGKNPSDYWEILVQDWDELVWNIPNVKCNHPEKTCHPCQFPVELVERCVLALTNEDDWVFDPYAGVASALIAAIKHNRRAMGCEKENDYITVGRKRLQEFYDGSLRTRDMGKPIYTPSGREKISRPPDEWLTNVQAQFCEHGERYE